MSISRGLGFLGLFLLLLAAGGIWLIGQKPAQIQAPVRVAEQRPTAQPLPPVPPVVDTAFMPVTVTEAKAINAAVAFSTEPVQVARPFILPMHARAGGLEADVLSERQRALDCLTSAVYYEAASEGRHGQLAVAQVVLNRMRHPAYPKSICGVVYQGAERATGCQFTFACDGSLARRPSQYGWQAARGIALAALAGAVEPAVGTATHYHTEWVVPYWASSLDKVAVIGAHIFYRWKGYWGKRSAFSGAYAGETLDRLPGMILPAMAYDVPADSAVTAVDGKGVGDHALPVTRTRLLADMAPAVEPRDRMALPKATGLRADQAGGVLLADQNRGKLDDARLRGAGGQISTP